MASKFYSCIIEDEKKSFCIKDEALKTAAKAVAKTYSRNALSKGSTFLDYNMPSNRCAYLHKYATIHTALVTKYFRKLAEQEEVKELLQAKSNIKICCLGGGPGTDIVGIFKALSEMPCYQKKIVEVTVLDICGGWRNSFKRIISGLCNEEIEEVPTTFVECAKFKAKLISVDLLNPFPANVMKIISDADIICMVKFVSAVLGNPASLKALKEIGEKLKIGAVVLFIDNLRGGVGKSFQTISGQIGLRTVLGPLNKVFRAKVGCSRAKYFASFPKSKVFDCLPLSETAVSVIGFRKDVLCAMNSQHEDNNLTNGVVDNDSNLDTEKEGKQSILLHRPAQTIQYREGNILQNGFCDKFTQTEATYFNDEQKSDELLFANMEKDFKSLLISLDNLMQVLSKFQNTTISKRGVCCNCHGGPY